MAEAVGVEVAGELFAGELMASQMIATEFAAGGLLAGELAAGEMISGEIGGGLLAGELAAGNAIETAALNVSAPAAEIIGTGPASVNTYPNIEVQSRASQFLENPDAVPGGDVVTRGDMAYNSPAAKDGSILDWMNKNKTAAIMGGQLISGALQGAGAGIGATEAAKRKAESDKALLAQQTDEKQRLSREGTYTGRAAPTPSGNRVLRRLSNGQLVYVNSGIIGNQIA